MIADQAVAQFGVVGGSGVEYLPNRWYRHVKPPQPADQQRPLHLIERVPPVTGCPVHRIRRQQADVVVVMQRLHGQVGHPGELPDRHVRCHEPKLALSGYRRVKRPSRLRAEPTGSRAVPTAPPSAQAPEPEPELALEPAPDPDSRAVASSITASRLQKANRM